MSEYPVDAALEFRAGAEPVQVIAVTSGKGGVGKTNVSINLATALAKRGRSVMLLDADLGLANVDVVLGLKARRTLAHVLEGECELDEVVIHAPGEVRVVPAASGVQRMAGLSPQETAGIIHAFSELERVPDTLVVDTAAGINESVASFARAASDVLVVACDEPASITDAYALTKTLSRHHGVNEFRVLANMVRSAAQGREVFDKLSRVVHRFLDVSLLYEGFIPEDEFLRRAVQKQKPVVQAFPRCRASLAFRRLALRVSDWPVPISARGHVSFFSERGVNELQALESVG
jgi:flagellar biosynthesis protein FlhG